MYGNLFSPNAFQLKMNSDRRSFLSGIQFFSIIQSDSQKLMFLQFNFDLFALLRSPCSVVSVNIRIHTFFVLFFFLFCGLFAANCFILARHADDGDSVIERIAVPINSI